jgi:predicted metal-dependent hydrolase
MSLEPGGRARRRAEAQARRVVLSGQAVDYRLVRARRRSIGMEVHFDGLTVRAPRWVSLREIEATLVERGAWILRSLAEWRARRRDVMPREWKSGAPIVFRGAALALAI